MKANMCRKLKCVTSAPARLSVAMPLIFGLATIAAAPTVEAVTIEPVNILNSFVDVDQNGVINALDDLIDFALWCNDAAPIQADIIDGGVDVTQSGVVSAADDLFNCDLNDENNIAGVATPTTTKSTSLAVAWTSMRMVPVTPPITRPVSSCSTYRDSPAAPC